MKKLLITAVAIIAVFSLTTCETLMRALQEPVVSLHSVDIGNITLNGVQLLCKVNVQNPNPFEIPFPETDWNLFINTNSFVSGTVRNNNRLRANETTIVEVPVNLNYLELINSFASLLGSRQVAYKVALDLKFTLPVLGTKVWNFEHEGSLPIPQPPTVSRPTVRMENANTTRALLSVTVNVQNPNPFPIPTPRITYDYQLNRTSFIRGELENTAPLAASATTPVTFQLTVNYADLLRSFTALRNLFEVPSLLILTCDLGMPIFGREPLRFEVSGTLPVLR
ncbi:MAG: LEA type 2 family protein [Treponema sp.]|nr:LEA type 2 family protein [Treponema sp.]